MIPKFHPVTPPVTEISKARSTSDSGWTGRRLVKASAPAGIRPPTGNRRDRRPVSAPNSGNCASSASAARSWSEITRLTRRFCQPHPGAESRGELFVEVPRGSSRGFEKGFEMSPLLMVYFSVTMPVVGFGLVKLQARLEQWDYERHAED